MIGTIIKNELGKYLKAATAWIHWGNSLKFSGSIEVLRAEICFRNSQNKRKKRRPFDGKI